MITLEPARTVVIDTLRRVLPFLQLDQVSTCVYVPAQPYGPQGPIAGHDI